MEDTWSKLFTVFCLVSQPVTNADSELDSDYFYVDGLAIFESPLPNSSLSVKVQCSQEV
jgi:hypothetical protein